MKCWTAWCLALALVLGARTAAQAAGPQPSNDNVKAGGVSVPKFPLALFKKIAQGHTSENVLASPFSISSALTMTYMGAAGTTGAEMHRVLGLQGSKQEIAARCQRISDSLRKPGGTTVLTVSNGLFGEQSVKFNPEFLALNKQYFGAKISALDFKSPQTPAKIDAWVSESTHGKIPTIAGEISPDAVLYLINAIYFKGAWKHQFLRPSTEPAAFYLDNGKQQQVQMMNMFRHFSYLETPEFQAVSLPYSDDRLSLYVFLPKPGKSLELFEAQLNENNWKTWLSKFAYHEGSLYMPRFKIENAFTLNKPLIELGMSVPFDRKQADFSGMAIDEKVFMSKILHKTYMDVNEEGTEAAAVTAVMMLRATSAPPNRPTPFKMIVNRPYFIAMHDSQTDTLLFVGHVANPVSAK